MPYFAYMFIRCFENFIAYSLQCCISPSNNGHKGPSLLQAWFLLSQVGLGVSVEDYSPLLAK
jgi:hypothetical protein